MSAKDINSKQDIFLREMKFSELKDRVVIAFVSKRGGGKTFACINYLYEKRHKPICVVISATEKVNGTYSKYVPAPFIHLEYSEEIMKSIMARQEWAMNYAKENPSFDPDIVIVMDDLFANDNIFKYDKTIKNIFLNGRHYGITILVCTQYLKYIAPGLRGNIDYILAFNSKNEKDINVFKEEYGDIIKNKETFNTIFTELTKDRGIMLFKPQGGGNDTLEDYIFSMKATEVPKFTFGDDFSKKYSKIVELNEKKKQEKDKQVEEAHINKAFYDNNTRKTKLTNISIKPLNKMIF